MKRIHITGCPRSGTTLMMELMRTCFKCDAYCEHEVSIFEPVSGSPDIYFSKQPSDVKRMEPLLSADRNLYSITMIRDPRSVITSQHKNLPGTYFCNFRIWNDCYQAAKQLKKHPRNIAIQYEDLVQNPDGVQIRIEQAFSFLKKTGRFSDYHQIAKPSKDANAALGGVRQISDERIRSWQNHLPRIKHEWKLHRELEGILIDEGYESDHTWTTQFEGVEPKKGTCRYPDKQNPLKKLEYTIRTRRKTAKYIKKTDSRLLTP